jgi:spermidine synthase
LPVFGINLRGGEISYYREGITGTVTIHDSPGSRILSINGADVAGTSFMLRTTQKLQAHIPLLLHPDPRQVLQVGLGSGETAHSILLHPEVERLVGCDISPEVIEAGAHFRAINEEVYANPRLEIVIEDAKNFTKYTDRSFDLILNDSVHPIFRGSSDLYARDYFEGCRARLAEGGMMSSWFPIALLSEADLRMLLRTFQEVFPTSTVWIATNAITRNALLLGWKHDGPLALDFLLLARRIRGNPALQNDLAEVNLFTPYLLLDSFMLDPVGIRELTEGARINTYDRPHLEFSAPRVLARGDRLLWARNFETIVSRRKPVLPYLVDLAPDTEGERRVRERLEKRRTASEHVLEGLVLELSGRRDLARDRYEGALSILPRDPIAKALLAKAEQLDTALETRVASGSEDPHDWFLLGKRRREEGRAEEAAELLARAVQLRPGHVRAQTELAIVLRDLERLPEAREAIERAIEVDPRLVGAWAVRGSIAVAEGDLAAAEADLRKASEAGAALPWAELLLGRVLADRGEVEEARRHLLAAVDLAPDSPAAAQARELLKKSSAPPK